MSTRTVKAQQESGKNNDNSSTEHLATEQVTSPKQRTASDYIVDENSDNYNEIFHAQFEPEEVDSEAIAQNKNFQTANSQAATVQEETDEDDDFQLLKSTVVGLLTLMSRPRPNTPSRPKNSIPGDRKPRSLAVRALSSTTIGLLKLASRPKPNTTSQPIISTPGSNRKPKSQPVHFVNPGETPAKALENAPPNHEEEDENLQLLTLTLGNVVTLMSRRQKPNVGSRTRTSQPGAVRMKTFGVVAVNQSTQIFHRLVQAPLKWLAIVLTTIQKLIAKTPTTKQN